MSSSRVDIQILYNPNEIISVYPNPSAGMVNLKSSDFTCISEIKVYDDKGKLVKVIKAENNKDTIDNFQLCELNSGLYKLMVQTMNDILKINISVYR